MDADPRRPHRRSPNVAVLAFVLSIAAGAGAAVASEIAPARPGVLKRSSAALAEATGEHHWHDGRVRRVLSLEPGMQADFSVGMTEKSTVLRASKGALKDVSPALQSPVFRDESGRPRALPGGVIVVFDAPVSEAEARAAVERQGARVSRRIGERVWLVASEPGLAALELANRLHETGGFASAQPNWWVERTKK